MVAIARSPGKRGRPSREEEREITIAILDAGLRMFLEHGYGATTMKRIGEEAGVAPNTLYMRFPDKATLFRAIIEWKTALWKVTNPPRLAPHGAPLYEVLRVAVTAMLEAMCREDISGIGRLLELEAGRFPELASIYLQVAATIGQDGLIASIKNCGDCELSDEDVQDLAKTLLECAAGHMKYRMLSSSSDIESQRRAAERIARVFSRP